MLNAEGKDVLRDVAFELNDLNDGKTEVPRVPVDLERVGKGAFSQVYMESHL